MRRKGQGVVLGNETCKPCKKGGPEVVSYWAYSDGRVVRQTNWHCVVCTSGRVSEQEVKLCDVPEGQQRQQVEYLLDRIAANRCSSSS
jgi:hypothetical protein